MRSDAGALARAPQGRTVTSHDVARRAGVSQSAVSRAFTSGASIAGATRARVLAAASTLDYRPNQVARALSSERSGLVGLVIPPDFIPLYSLAIGEFARVLPARGLQPLVLTAEQSTRADELVDKFLQYRVDAVVLTMATLSSRLASVCARQGIPVIQFGRAELDARGPRVSSDNYGGGRIAGRLLRLGGARRAAYLGGDPDTSTDRDRRAGFLREWPNAPQVSAGRFGYEEGAVAARKILGAARRPDAVFGGSDVLAYALLDVARYEFGLRLPQDLALIGVDDAPPSAWQGYALTTLRQDVPHLVAATADLLVRRIGKSAMRAVTVRVPMLPVLRATTPTLAPEAVAQALKNLS